MGYRCGIFETILDQHSCTIIVASNRTLAAETDLTRAIRTDDPEAVTGVLQGLGPAEIFGALTCNTNVQGFISPPLVVAASRGNLDVFVAILDKMESKLSLEQVRQARTCSS